MRQRINEDTKGISTTVTVILVAAIIVVAAVAVFVFINKDNDDKNDLWTDLKYDADGEYAGAVFTGEIEFHMFEKNTEHYSYHVEAVADIDWGGYKFGRSFEITADRETGVPSDAIKEGTVEKETIDGIKTLGIWRYTVTLETPVETVNIVSYVDQDSKIPYLTEMVFNTEDGNVSFNGTLIEKKV